MNAIRWFRRFALVALAAMAVVPVAAQSVRTAESQAPASVPAARQADRVAIVTMTGEIDQWTERSMKRRIEQAEFSGANALVIEIDSPGGEVGAVLEICNTIKGSSIKNTVAWVHPDAYSGGAIVALACSEIVTSDPASMGDAFPITFGPQGVRGLSPDERTKFLPPLLTEVADSARRNGYDEFLVQAMVVDDIELWSVKDSETGELWFINENEYKMLFEGDPPRGKPVLVSVTGGRASTKAASSNQRNSTADREVPADTSGEDNNTDATEGDETRENTPSDTEPNQDTDEEAKHPVDDWLPSESGNETERFTPAGPSVIDLAESASEGLFTPSSRPVFSEDDRGRYIEPRYIADGTGPIVLRADQLTEFGFTSATIQNDAELEAFFGAKEMTRTAPSWSEKLVRTMMNPIVRGVLIVALLIGLFVEMSSPGMVIPGIVAAGSLVGLIAPPMLIGMAGWWEIAAIGIGILCLLVELLVIPGFGLFGLIGIVSLFVGMVGTFIPDGTGDLFGNGTQAQEGLFNGVATILLSTVTAAVLIFFLSKHFGSIPLLSRLVLQDAEPMGETSGVLMAMQPDIEDRVQPGDIGVAASALRPSGRALVNGEMLDAIAARGYIDDGEPIEVVEKRGFSWVVMTPRSLNPHLGDGGASDQSQETEGL